MRIDYLRTELLRDALQSAADALYRRHASEIPEGYIEDFVTLDWLEWRGGGLRLTSTGENVCNQLRQRAQQGLEPALPATH